MFAERTKAHDLNSYLDNLLCKGHKLNTTRERETEREREMRDTTKHTKVHKIEKFSKQGNHRVGEKDK